MKKKFSCLDYVGPFQPFFFLLGWEFFSLGDCKNDPTDTGSVKKRYDAKKKTYVGQVESHKTRIIKIGQKKNTTIHRRCGVYGKCPVFSTLDGMEIHL